MPEQDQTITAMDAANIIAAEKENVGPSQGGKDTDNIQSTPVQAMSEFPRTPAARVPLADLIGNSIEDPFEQPPNPTPMERVVWKHSPSDSDRTLPNSTPNPRRGKKRARSSSPASSGKPKSPGRASFNVQNLQASLKTPQIDPAGELERRYFSMAKHTTPSKPPSSAAADIMHSSPQTPAFGLTDSAKLRRTMSCGMAWPMSYKRRKINQGPNDQQQPAQTIGNGGDQIGPRRIQYLLEEIQNELPPLSQRQRQKTPTSSSPVQSIHVRQVTKVRFTSQNVGHGNMDPDPEPSPDVTASTPKDSHQINHDVADISKKPHDEFDEFDDDEMDDMLMNSMDVYPMPAPTRNLFPTAQGPQGVPQQPQARTLDHAHPAVIEQSVVEVESPMSLPAIARDATTEEPYGRNREPLSDEFGDDDFEDADFAADIEKVAMLYDTQRPGGQVMSHQTDDRHIKATREPVSHRPAASKTSTKNPDPLNITCVEISSDEEFGDDFDVDDMISECEQVEMAGGKSVGLNYGINKAIK